MFVLTIPNTHVPERTYVANVIFREILGLMCEVEVEVATTGDVTLTGPEGKSLVFQDDLFTLSHEDWLTTRAMPRTGLPSWTVPPHLSAALVQPEMPILFGATLNDESWVQEQGPQTLLGLDIWGSAFFMLTRYEEDLIDARDHHERFQGLSSTAHREGFLQRPLINEYAEILWALMNRLWPGLERKPRDFSMFLTHDIDSPFRHAMTGPRRTAAASAKLAWIARNPLYGINYALEWLGVRALRRSDPHDTYDAIMNLSERHGCRSAFYFIADRTARSDGYFPLNHPKMTRALRRIAERGHEIGLHPSYHTYLDARQTRREFEILKDAARRAGSTQTTWGGRQHFLRWSPTTTLANWEHAGLNYDSTLGYQDISGFRCGVCTPFTTFDLKARRPFSLKERPLIIMESTVLDPKYLGLAQTEVLDTILALKTTCRRFAGEFVVLWHNHRFVDPTELDFYRGLLEG